MAHLTTKQLKQLIEIDHAGPGIRAELQELIERLTPHDVCSVENCDPRAIQAARLWDKGFGRGLGIESFEQYLASIPVIPKSLREFDERFTDLILVDARHSIVKLCNLLGISHSSDLEFEDFDPKQTRDEQVYWVLLQDGTKYRNKSIQKSRKEFASNEIGVTVHEALAFFAQSPNSFRKFALEAVGSVNRKNRRQVACIWWLDFRPELGTSFDEEASPDFGSGSRRK